MREIRFVCHLWVTPFVLGAVFLVWLRGVLKKKHEIF